MFSNKLFIFLCLIPCCLSIPSHHGHEKFSMMEQCCSVVNECFDYEHPFSNIPLPDCPIREFKIKYLLYSRDDIYPTSFSIDTVPKNEFQDGKPVIFLVHGWRDTIEKDAGLRMKDELLKKEDSKVILVDWRDMASSYLYPNSVSNTRPTGAHIAKVLDEIKSASKADIYSWCIGHSLGAHVCGQVGRRTKLNRITGLDPAGPFFNMKSPEICLNPESADFVDVMHTSFSLGYFEPLGDADYYVNGGTNQPQCSRINKKCDHDSATDLMVASINNHCFKAQKCQSHIEFPSSCNECTDCAQMGYAASPNDTGIFYLETSSSFPFCKKDPELGFPYNVIYNPFHTFSKLFGY